MTGIIRNDAKQFLINNNIGKASWSEWHERIEGINDDLPVPKSLADVSIAIAEGVRWLGWRFRSCFV